MSEPNEPADEPADDLHYEPLTEEQSIVGATRHRRTGAYIVWVSLEGNDITPVGAWKDEATASEVVQEAAHEFHRMVDAMDKAVPGQENEAGFQHWSAFLNDMKARSTAAVTPFDDTQLVQIGQNIARMMQQKKNVPHAPEGFARVLIYSEAALGGAMPPRVRLAPMSMPPKKRKGQHTAASKGQRQPPMNPLMNPRNISSASNAPDPIYLSYTDAGGAAPYFQVLDGEDGLALIKAGAPIMGRIATLLHTRGKAGDAPLEIVCVTDAPINQAQAEAISQKAINYAMETGLLPMQRDEPNEPPQAPRGGSGYGFSPN